MALNEEILGALRKKLAGLNEANLRELFRHLTQEKKKRARKKRKKTKAS